MTDTKHTPGPWVAQVRNTIIPDCITADITPNGDEYRGDVARLQSCEHIDGITQDEMRANAHLIAAAPDLLEALEEVLDGLGFLSGGDHELEGYGIDEARGAEIRAAIAKAKGQTE